MVRLLLNMLSKKTKKLTDEPSKVNNVKICGLSFLEGLIDGCFVVGALAFLAGLFGKKPKKK